MNRIRSVTVPVFIWIFLKHRFFSFETTTMKAREAHSERDHFFSLLFAHCRGVNKTVGKYSAGLLLLNLDKRRRSLSNWATLSKLFYFSSIPHYHFLSFLICSAVPFFSYVSTAYFFLIFLTFILTEQNIL